MDLWVVAAAAGAGYLAKHWQSFLRDKEDSSGFLSGSCFPDNPDSPALIQQIHNKNCPIRKLSRSTKDGPVVSELTSPSVDHENQVENYENSNIPSSILRPELTKYENFAEYRDVYRLGADSSDIPEYHSVEMGTSHVSRRSKNSLRSKRLHLQFIKPRSSLDSCLMAQMYREHTEMEDYILTPLSSPRTPTLRPFLVTDGRRVISRTNGDFRDVLHKEFYPKADDEVVGVPPLPRISEDDYSERKLNEGKSQMGRSSNTNDLMQIDSRGSTGQVLFCLGISIGIMSTIIANKLEVEKMKEHLKQSQNLVQDLQEELEMKDSLTVKELVNDDDSQDTHESSFVDKKLDSFSNQVDTNMLVKHADRESGSLKKVESMSEIEAELEAELERLELSIKGSTIQGRFSDDIELDEDIMAELVHGELMTDIGRRESSSEPTPDRSSSRTSTPHSEKDGVSPRELSLRLHEVIRSRLVERVIELEAELTKSRKRVQHLESGRIKSRREVSNSESSSTPGSPSVVETRSSMARPLVMNLSENALDAYNEAYEELNKLKGTQNKTSVIQFNSQQQDDSYDRQNGTRNGTMTWLSIPGERTPANDRTRIPSNEGSLDGYEFKYDDDDDDDDDDDLLLIKQIVEKARQGSPALSRAQRAMVSLDRD